MVDPEYLYLLFVIPYFLPSFVAAARGHRNAGAIFLLNLVLGWTVFGWIIALVWAARIQPDRRKYPRFSVPSDVPLRCIVNFAGVAPLEAQTPGEGAIVVDLEVRRTRSIVQPDGGIAQRSSVHFLDEAKGIDALLKRFDTRSGEGHEAG